MEEHVQSTSTCAPNAFIMKRASRSLLRQVLGARQAPFGTFEGQAHFDRIFVVLLTCLNKEREARFIMKALGVQVEAL